MTGPKPEQKDEKPVSYFVTSFLPHDDAAALVRLGARLNPTVVANPIPHIHITYRSFDGLPHGLFAPLKAVLRDVAAAHQPFDVQLRGGGCFAAGAIWVRVVSPEILALQADVDAALTRVGCPPASHPFVPHVTLGHGAAGFEPPTWLSEVDLPSRISEIYLTTTGHMEYRVALRMKLGETEDDDSEG